MPWPEGCVTTLLFAACHWWTCRWANESFVYAFPIRLIYVYYVSLKRPFVSATKLVSSYIARSLPTYALFKMSSSFSTIATALFSTFVLVTAYQSPYIPAYANCPSTPLVRHAPPSDPLGGDGICQAELNYITQRYQNAQRSLANWLPV
jgi:hypothetical protein